MAQSPELLAHGVKVIDLAADFRIKDVAEFEKWYKIPHTEKALLEEAVYGLPEMRRAEIAKARIVANPGCYATAVQLGFLPLVEAGVVDLDSLIADGGVRCLRRRPQGGGGQPVLGGERQLQGLRSRWAPPPARNPPRPRRRGRTAKSA